MDNFGRNMRSILLSLLVSTFCLVVQAQTPDYRYSPAGGTVSDFFVLGQSQTRHNQTLYGPGLFGLMPDTIRIRTIYLRYGQNTVGQGNTRLDSLMLRLGQTDSTRLSANGNLILFQPDSSLRLVRFDSSLAISEGTSSDWMPFPLQQPFVFDSRRSLVLDIRFKSSSNAFFNTMGSIRVNERIRIGARRFEDTVGGLSEVAPHLGFDMMIVSNRPSVKVNQLTISPNPSTGSILIKTKEAFIGKPYRIVDALGRAVRQGVLQDRMPITGLRQGCYRLLAESASHPIVVQ